MWSKNCPDEIFSDEEFDRQAEALRVLTEYYPHAKRAIIMLEIYSKKRSTRAVYELRDTFDHVSIALSEETPPAEARRHFAECFTHLRRAAVEPYEWLAERRFLEIEKILVKGKWLYWLLFLTPPAGTTFASDLRDIATLIIDGRNSKGTKESLTHMQQAVEKSTELLDQLKPREINDRIYAIVLLVIGAALSPIMGCLWNLLFDKK